MFSYLGLALAGAGLAWMMEWGLWAVFGGAMTLRLLAVAIPLLCIAFALATAVKSTGRIVLATATLAVSAALFFSPIPITLVVFGQGFMLWGVRCYMQSRTVVGAVLDGALLGMGLLGAVAAYSASHGLTMAVWTGLLIQCAAAWIPKDFGEKRPPSGDGDRFVKAHTAAEAALRALSGRSKTV